MLAVPNVASDRCLLAKTAPELWTCSSRHIVRHPLAC